MKKIISILALAILSFSCEEIDDGDYFDTVQQVDTTDTEQNNRNVLIIEYTAFQCNNCPPASKEVERIIDLYDGKVIGMNIHASQLANPTGPDDPILFNSESIELWETAGSPSLPSGVVNYFASQFELQNAFVTWSNDAALELEKETHLEIFLSKGNVSTENLEIDIDLVYSGDQKANERLAVFLIEDGIIGRQLDRTKESGEVKDYVHNHVTRGGIENIAGKEIFESAGSSSTLTYNYSYQFPAAVSNPENCRVIAFVFDSDDRYIYQVNELMLFE